MRHLRAPGRQHSPPPSTPAGARAQAAPVSATCLRLSPPARAPRRDVAMPSRPIGALARSRDAHLFRRMRPACPRCPSKPTGPARRPSVLPVRAYGGGGCRLIPARRLHPRRPDPTRSGKRAFSPPRCEGSIHRTPGSKQSAGPTRKTGSVTHVTRKLSYTLNPVAYELQIKISWLLP